VVGWLEHPRAGWVVVAFALVIALPSLTLGFFADDYVFLDELEHRLARDIPWWDLYRFTPGDPAAIAHLVAAGELPWWTNPELKLHFARPLPSALLALDHALFGHVAPLWHLHSLLWYAAMLVAVRSLFRRLLPPATATLALFLFALSGALASPVAWISARHYLAAALFCALGLLAQQRWRAEAWQPGRWLAPLSFSVALLCDEAALGGLALAFAYDVLGPSPRDLRARSLGAMPFVAIVMAYLAIYSATGCGADGGGGYLSPISEPGKYLAGAATRFPDLLADAILGVPAELALTWAARPLAVVGVVAAVLAGLLLRDTLRRATDEERAAVRWLLPGALVAAFAAVGGFPGARELVVPNLGVSATLAVMLAHGFTAGRGALARRALAGLLAIVHVGLAPLAQLGNQHSMKTMALATARITAGVAGDIGPRGRLRILQASDPMANMYVNASLAFEVDRGGACAAPTSAVHADVLLERTGPRTFTLAPRGTTFLTGPFEYLARSAWHPMAVGDERRICGAVVRVVALDGGLPSRIEITDDADLDDPSAPWLAWQGRALQRVAFPPVGGTTVIRWTPGPMGMF
jgi:hypothetical protein